MPIVDVNNMEGRGRGGERERRGEEGRGERREERREEREREGKPAIKILIRVIVFENSFGVGSKNNVN